MGHTIAGPQTGCHFADDEQHQIESAITEIRSGHRMMNSTVAATATNVSSTPSRLTMASLMLAELCGEYSSLIMPFILVAMMGASHLTEATAGRLVSLQLLGMTLASSFVSITLRPGRSLRLILAFAVTAIVVANIMCAVAHAALIVAAARALTGIGEGAAMSAATAAVCATSNPHRVYSMIGMASGTMAIVLLAVAPYIAGHAGAAGLFWMLALLPLPALPLLGGIPLVAVGPPVRRNGPVTTLLYGAPILLAYLAFWMGTSGMWVYAERIGATQGLTPQQVGLSLSLGQLAATPAPLFAAWLGPRIGLPASVAVGCAGMAVAAACFVFGGHPWTYGLGAFLAPFWLLFAVPSFRSRMAVLDPSGRTVAISVVGYTIGFGAAPLVVSAVTTGGRGYALTGLICIASFAAGGVLGSLPGFRLAKAPLSK